MKKTALFLTLFLVLSNSNAFAERNFFYCMDDFCLADKDNTTGKGFYRGKDLKECVKIADVYRQENFSGTSDTKSYLELHYSVRNNDYEIIALIKKWRYYDIGSTPFDYFKEKLLNEYKSNYKGKVEKYNKGNQTFLTFKLRNFVRTFRVSQTKGKSGKLYAEILTTINFDNTHELIEKEKACFAKN